VPKTDGGKEFLEKRTREIHNSGIRNKGMGKKRHQQANNLDCSKQRQTIGVLVWGIGGESKDLVASTTRTNVGLRTRSEVVRQLMGVPSAERKSSSFKNKIGRKGLT